MPKIFVKTEKQNNKPRVVKEDPEREVVIVENRTSLLSLKSK